MTTPAIVRPGSPQVEYLKCARSLTYFASHYVQIYDATGQTWLPFQPWPAQRAVLADMQRRRLLVILKARQLGLSWLACAYALWLMTFGGSPPGPATILFFSQRAVEAEELLARLRQMYWRLPGWLQSREILRANEAAFELANGSRALAFSTRGGRSYTGTLAIIDEADHVPDLSAFLNAVKPTIDAGGKLFLISTADKARPVSPFKRLFRAAQSARKDQDEVRRGPSPEEPRSSDENGGSSSFQGAGDYYPIFLPWNARPGRDQAWHDRTRAEMFAQRGTDDDFFAEYPATVEEALAPEQLDRRIPLHWLKPCLDLGSPISDFGAQSAPQISDSSFAAGAESIIDNPKSKIPSLPGLAVWQAPELGRHYVIGADPAEGNPNSDESAATVLDSTTWEQVAALGVRVEPTVFGHYLDQLAAWYNHADVMVERNNHGHTVIASLRDAGSTRILAGLDGKPGWLSNVKGKPVLYDALADAIRDQATLIRDGETANQIASIEASKLAAPKGLHDDRADSFALAIAALRYANRATSASTAVPPADPLQRYDARGAW